MSNEVTVNVDQGIWWELHQTMVDARENAVELYNQHSIISGEETKREKCIIKMYSNEIERLDKLIVHMERNGGIPF